MYINKFSSGTILALLALSGMLFLVPLAAPVHASNTTLPSITITGANPVKAGTTGNVVDITISNPTGNAYTVTGFTILVPTGWTVTACGAGGFLDVCRASSTGSSVTYSVPNFFVGTAAGIPPGASDLVSVTLTAPTGTSYPLTGTFTSKVQDASAVSFYNGPSFNLVVMDPTTAITVTAIPTTYVAGSSPITVTATVTCTVSSTCPSGTETGLPVTFTAPGYVAGTTYTFTPSSTSSGTGGKTTTTFQPSNHAGDATSVLATIGTSTVNSGSSSGTITTVAGPPSTITFSFATSASNGNHYVTTEGTTTNTATGGSTFTGAKVANTFITFAITDKFGNTQTFNAAGLTAFTLTLTAISGGGLFDATGLPATMSCSNGGNWMAGATNLGVACPSSGSSASIPFNYYQSATYGAIGELSMSVSGTYSSSSFAGAGVTKNVITSTFGTASPIPMPVPYPSTATWTISAVPAGSQVNVTAAIAPPSTCGTGTSVCPGQPGVPITLFLDKVTSYETVSGAKDYGAMSDLPAIFAGATTMTTVTTKNGGAASALFTVDTVAGSHAYFFANVTAPTDTSLTNSLGASADSSAVITVPGAPSTFSVNVYYTYTCTGTCPPAPGTLSNPVTYAATGSTVYVDVLISDKYGNLATNPGPGQIQISLTTSPSGSAGGVLSATSVYIPVAYSDTNGGFGPITWTMPSTTQTAITLTASGVLLGASKSGSATVTTVSPLPTLAIKSPAPNANYYNVIYSSTGSVVFTGQANASKGYASTGSQAVKITSVGYKIDSGSVQTAIITPANSVTFSVAAVLSNGQHTITFNATDSKGNVVVGQTYKVLVDTQAPKVTFVTKPGGSIGSGQTLQANIVAYQGDLNLTAGATVTYNGTKLAASSITITPNSNTLGTNTTYSLSAVLPSGTWVVQITATSLTGLTSTAVSETVTVTVPFADSITFNTATATYGTVGAYKGVTVSVTNSWNTQQTIVVFATLKSGTSVYVAEGTVTLAAGQTQSVFTVDLQTVPAGTYTVTFAAVTTSNLAVSAPTTPITLTAT